MSNTEPSSGRPLRLLAPAPSPGSGHSSSSSSAKHKEPVPRRKLVKNACRTCQAKKTKCCGKRPHCTRCAAKGLQCTYDTLYEGMTKQQSSEYEISRLQDVLSDNSKKFNVLKYGTYDEAQAMLASIRQDALNEEIDDESQLPQTSDTIYIAYVTPGRMDSETLTEQHFLPLLFDRLEWKRDPSSLPDGNGSRSLLDSETLNIETTSNNDQFGLDGGLIPDQPSGFGNLPFSSGVLANHYPMGVQQQQHENLFRPLWAILPLTTLAGKPSVKECIAGVLRQARLLLQSGQSTEQIIGRKCNIASIFDQNQFSRSTMLTKWAARFVYSMQHKDHDFVAFAAMHLVWTLTRWMISPRPDTYEAVPEWYRPTMLQLWTPHVEIVDFVLWPALRDKVTREPQVLQSDWRWLEHICQSIDCDWFVDLDVALEVNGNTGECYLTDAAKESAEQLSNWSVAGSAGQHFDAVESFTKVRPMPF